MENAEVIKDTASYELPKEACYRRGQGYGGKPAVAALLSSMAAESGHTSSSPSAHFLLEGLDQKPKGSSSSGALELA